MSTLADDPDLLAVMMRDLREQKGTHRLGPFWQGYARRIERAVRRHGRNPALPACHPESRLSLHLARATYGAEVARLLADGGHLGAYVYSGGKEETTLPADALVSLLESSTGLEIGRIDSPVASKLVPGEAFLGRARC